MMLFWFFTSAAQQQQQAATSESARPKYEAELKVAIDAVQTASQVSKV